VNVLAAEGKLIPIPDPVSSPSNGLVIPKSGLRVPLTLSCTPTLDRAPLICAPLLAPLSLPTLFPFNREKNISPLNRRTSKHIKIQIPSASVRRVRRLLLALLGFVVALGFGRGRMRGELGLLKWKGAKTHETKDALEVHSLRPYTELRRRTTSPNRHILNKTLCRPSRGL